MDGGVGIHILLNVPLWLISWAVSGLAVGLPVSSLDHMCCLSRSLHISPLLVHAKSAGSGLTKGAISLFQMLCLCFHVRMYRMFSAFFCKSGDRGNKAERERADLIRKFVQRCCPGLHLEHLGLLQ